MNCTREDCPYKDTIDDHEVRIRSNERNKIDVISLKKDVEYIVQKIDPLAKAIEEIKNRPGKQWDILITALISGGGMYFITTIIK